LPDLQIKEDTLASIKEDIQAAFNYHPNFIEIIFTLFSPEQAVQFIEACESTRPLTVRTNTLKIWRRDLSKKLLDKQIQSEPFGAWSKVGLTITNIKEEALQCTLEYLNGEFIVQAASSLLPVIALCPQPDDKILDMAAAPGGKATYIAQLMKNTGCLVANDIEIGRCEALENNIKRLGITNTIVINKDGRKLPKSKDIYDRVLLDAPCSGTGVISDTKNKSDKSIESILDCSKLQKELLISAIDCVDSAKSKGGFVVYSVSSIAVEECECVVQYALNKRHVKVVETGIEIGSSGLTGYKEKRFDNGIKLCKRVFPHSEKMDGYFIAKLKKIANGEKVINNETDTAPISQKKLKKREKKRLKKKQS